MLISLFVILLSPFNLHAAEVCAPVKNIKAQVVRSFNRDTLAFTECLVFDGQNLIEATGPFKQQAAPLNKIDVNTGHVTKLADTPTDAFEEGLTRFGNEYIQVTWKEKKIFFWDGTNWTLDRQMPAPTDEGWGIATYGNSLVIGYGTNEFSIVDPGTLMVTKKVQLIDPQGKKHMPNELEAVDGLLYANDFLTSDVLQVDLNTGCLMGVMDLSMLYSWLSPAELKLVKSDQNFVLNGIAYDPQNDVFYITGKYWAKVFVIKIMP